MELNAVTPREHSKQLSKNTVPTTHCPRCLGSGHEAAVCRFKTAKCHKCKKKGHIAKACKSEGQRPVQSGQQPVQSGQTKHKRGSNGMHQITSGEVADIVHIHTISESLPKSYIANMKVNGVPLEMEIDTRAAVSIVSEATWVEKLNKHTLKPCPLVLKGYPDNELHIMGCCDIQVQTGETIKQLELIVCKGNGLSLLGRNWLEEMKLN